MLISAVINVDDDFACSNLLQSAMRSEHTIQEGDPVTQSSNPTRSFIVTNNGLIDNISEVTKPVEFLVRLLVTQS